MTCAVLGPYDTEHVLYGSSGILLYTEKQHPKSDTVTPCEKVTQRDGGVGESSPFIQLVQGSRIVF